MKSTFDSNGAAAALTVSRVGPQIWLWQNCGVAKTSTNGWWAARAPATDVR